MIPLFLIILLTALALTGVTLWNVLAWPGVTAAAPPDGRQGTISILVPARDEERNLGECLDAALAQGPVVGEVLIYDDHSADATPRIVADYARRDPRVRAVAPRNLPDGWCGKNFACARLAEAARGEWLLYLDADARLHRGAAARMLAEASARRVTLLSCWPALDLRGFWERALMPLLNFVVFTLYPAPLSFRRNDHSLGLAHGACLLVNRAAYGRTGGHGAVSDAINEDVRLARHWRASGERGLCFDGGGIVSVRMYRSFGEIWAGFEKNFFPSFRRQSSFWAFVALHLLVFLLPFALAPFATRLAGGRLLWAAALCVLVMRAALAIRFRHPWWSVALHPLGQLTLLALGLSSWRRCTSGRGVEWKGRRYRAATSHRTRVSRRVSSL